MISGQPLPIGGGPATGAGLRAWSLGQGLEARGFEVIYSLPTDVVARIPSPPQSIRETAFEYHRLDDTINRIAPTVVLLQGFPLANLMSDRPDLPLAIDLNGPFLIENLFSRIEDTSMMPFRKLKAFQMADFITCSGEVQRHYFLSWLLLAGHDLLSSTCPSIPVSLNPDLPAPRPPKEPTFIYGGIFLPWQDPSRGLRRIIRRLDERGRGRLVIFGGPHPSYEFPTGDMIQLVDELKTHPRVEFAGLVPHETVMARYLESTVFVELMKKNIERELAFTNRTIGALWSGLPIIYNDYSELSSYIRDYQAGWTIDPDDEAGLDAVVDEVLDCPEQIGIYQQNAQRLVRERFAWDVTIEPLAAFCRHPFKRERQPSILDQTVSPLDDRLGRMFLQLKDSGFYQGLKNIKRAMGR